MDNNILLACKALQNHGVISFPTDTVMGLGVVYDDFVAYTKLNKVKRRPESKPYSMMVARKEDIDKYAEISIAAKLIIDKYLPGPLTILVKAKANIPGYVTHNTGIIGIRVAPTEELTNLITLVEKPLLVPSANISGEKPALNATEVKEIFGDEIDFVLEGEAHIGKATTIVSLSNEKPELIREGPVDFIDIVRTAKGE